LNVSLDIKFIKQHFDEFDIARFHYFARTISNNFTVSFFFSFPFLVPSLRSFKEKYHEISLQAILNSIKPLQVSSMILSQRKQTFTVIFMFSNLEPSTTLQGEREIVRTLHYKEP